ncbi:MAG: protein kinase [Chloroflexi bacterium]|nr:protein kinase [Chloroflexota bacterium]
MTTNTEALAALHRHLQSIFDADLETYHATTTADLTLYEWYIVPHRIDGVPFHDFMMIESARPDVAGGQLDPTGAPGAEKPRTRYDLANLKLQQYGETVIASYTMMLSQSAASGVRVRSYNESRVLIKLAEGWKVAHVHKSPDWRAPFQPPS